MAAPLGLVWLLPPNERCRMTSRSPTSFFERLKRRKVVEWTFAYVAAAWLVAEAADLFGGRWGLSESALRSLDLILVLGLIGTVVIAWYHGARGKQRFGRRETIVLAVFLGLGAFGVAWSYGRTSTGAAADEPLRVVSSDPFEGLPALAVLPFQNRSGLQQDQFFTDGFHDELRTALSRISALRVLSWGSVQEYRSSPKGPREIGAELGVGYLLEGSVQRADTLVRLNFYLIDASDGRQVWTDQFQRQLNTTNLFEIQSDVAINVAQELGAAISDDEVRRIAKRSTPDLLAYEDYLRAFGYSNDYVEPVQSDFEEAQRLFEQAIARDPDFALAYAGLAGVHGWFVLRRWDQSNVRRELARNAAHRAVDLDPDLPEAHYAMATYLYRVERDYRSALEELRLAERGLRGDGDAALLRAYVERRAGRLEDALASLARAQSLDPRSDVPVYQTGETLMRLWRYDEAEVFNRESVSMNPNRPGNSARLYRTLLYRDQNTDSLRAYLRTNPDPDFASQTRWTVEFLDRDWEAALRVLDQATATYDNQRIVRPLALMRAWTLEAAGDPVGAAEEYHRAESELRIRLGEAPEDDRILSALAMTLAGLGADDEAVRLSDRANELVPPEVDSDLGTFNIRSRAMVYSRLGRASRAVDELDRFFSYPSWHSVWSIVEDPRFDGIRSEEVFEELLSRHGAN